MTTKSRKIKWVVHGARCTVHVRDTRNADMSLVWKTECLDLAYHTRSVRKIPEYIA